MGQSFNLQTTEGIAKIEINGEIENLKCAKCQSLNPAGITHCKYCHNGFAPLKTFVDKSEVKKTKVKRNILIAGAGVVAAAAGYIWKSKTKSQQEK